MTGNEPERTGEPVEAHPTLSFKAGGWVIIASMLLSLALLCWGLAGVVFGERPIGNGTDILSYQFEIDNLTVARERVASSGNAREFLFTYRAPDTILGRDMIMYNEKNRRPWVVTGDRVVGVRIGDEARAYPVRCLNAHEIVQDEIDGVPIVVTYAPFADAPVVFINGEGEAFRDFRVSGLLLDSALLMFDARSENPSLWSTLFGDAISGPRVGTRLPEVAEVNLCLWKDWLARHPETTVILPDPASKKRYRKISYLRYFNDISDSLKFPVSPLPPDNRSNPLLPRLKARVIAVTAGGVRRIWPLTMMVEALGADRGTITVEQGGVPIRFLLNELPQTALVSAPDGVEITVQPRLWFAWYCSHPDSALEELVTEMPENAIIKPVTGN
ncbi:MAG: DUF3179 domain-containing protein [Phycisphaerales bacterium]|nr:DUF3179 domain-containing protein [Phycisphaerales bacterium]